MINIKEEQFYFNNDLAEYKNSVEGKEVQKAFSSNNLELIEKALSNYYYCRNILNKFTYKNDKQLKELQEQDNNVADILHNLD